MWQEEREREAHPRHTKTHTHYITSNLLPKRHTTYTGRGIVPKKELEEGRKVVGEWEGERLGR